MADPKNYGTVEQLAPSYDEAAAAAQKMYALHGSNASKQLQGIGGRKDTTLEEANVAVQAQTPSQLTEDQIDAGNDTLEQIMDLVSTELAIMEVSRQNTLERQQQSLDKYLQAMEAGLPYLEQQIDARLEALDGGSGSRSGSSSGTDSDGTIEEDGVRPDLTAEELAIFAEEYGDPEQADDPYTADQPYGSTPGAGSVSNLEQLAAIWGVDVMSFFVGLGGQIDPDTGQLLTGELSELLQTVQGDWKYYLGQGFSHTQAMNIIGDLYLAENLSEDESNNVTKFVKILSGLTQLENNVDGFADREPLSNIERAKLFLNEENGFYNADLYNYNPERNEFIRESPATKYKTVTTGEVNVQTDADGNPIPGTGTPVTRSVPKDEESRRYLTKLLNKELDAFLTAPGLDEETLAKRGFNPEEIDLIFELRKLKEAGKSENDPKVLAIRRELAEIEGSQETAQTTFGDTISELLGKGNIGPGSIQGVAAGGEEAYTKNLFAALTGDTENLVGGSATNPLIDPNDKYMQELMAKKKAGFESAQEIDSRMFAGLLNEQPEQNKYHIEQIEKLRAEREAKLLLDEEARKKTLAAQKQESDLMDASQRPDSYYANWAFQ